MRFAHGICIITEDVPRLAAFYQQVLEVTVNVNDIHVVIPVEDGSVTLYQKAAAQRDMGFDFTKDYGGGMMKFTMIVDDVDAQYQRLQSSGLDIDFVTAPTTYPWGARSMHFRDPDGHLICFVN